MSVFDISAFKARMKTGLLKSNKFVVSLDTIPQGMATDAHWQAVYKDLTFYCENVDVPASLIWTDEIKRYGYGPVEKKPYQPVFSDAKLVLRSDQNGDVFAFFRQWQACAINYQMLADPAGTISTSDPVSGLRPYEVGYKASYSVNLSITQYSEDGKAVLVIRLRDAWPSVIVEMPLAWAATRSYAQLPVALTFTDLSVTQLF